MKVTEHIHQAEGKTLFSFEVLPPKKGESVQEFFNAIDPLMEYKPSFIDVTYHREEIIKKTLPDGKTLQLSTKKRPGTVGICAAILNKYGIDPVPHLLCGGFSKEETENALIDLNFLGIDNILALQGDPLKNEKKFVPHPEGNKYASDLIQQIKGINEGKYLHDEVENAAKTDFCIGTAAYPEKHYAAANFDEDLKWLKNKIDLGAEYIVTQMFFENKHFFDFVDRCRANGIHVPIIPGLKPLATLQQVEILPKIFFMDIPEALKNEALKYSDNKMVKQIGIEWCIAQSKELKEKGVPVLHYYTMSRSETTKKVAQEVF
jgi:methylenetetrahydrofolate reductase (NADPH)